MKYHSENQLDIFEFHDSEFYFVSFEKEELIISVKHLNIHKATEQNPSKYDMEIECAKIIFRGFCASSYKTGGTWKTDAEGNLYPASPNITFEGKEAEEKIIQELQKKIIVLDLGLKNDDKYFIDGCGIKPFFTMEFCFDGVIVEWNEYCKKAWYELNKQYQYELKLETSHGEQTVNVHIIYHDESVCFKDKIPTVNVCIKYGGKELWGCGNDYLWVDAFANLQKQLPPDVFIKCCLTCRHGNMCPVGNQPGELFCTKDITITQKSDLFFYTEDDKEREKRSRVCTFVCDEYQMQNNEYYTYNNYLYYLNEA